MAPDGEKHHLQLAGDQQCHLTGWPAQHAPFVATSTTLILPSFPGYTAAIRPRGQQALGSVPSAINTRSPIFNRSVWASLWRGTSVGKYSFTKRCQK